MSCRSRFWILQWHQCGAWYTWFNLPFTWSANFHFAQRGSFYVLLSNLIIYQNRFIFFPNQECKNAQLVNSASRICTGHITRAPSEYIFQVNREQLKNSDGEEFTGVVFDAVEYIGGIQRPLAKGLDSQGRLRTITS